MNTIKKLLFNSDIFQYEGPKNLVIYILWVLVLFPIKYVITLIFFLFVFSWFLTGFGLFMILAAFAQGDNTIACILIAIDVFVLIAYIAATYNEIKK